MIAKQVAMRSVRKSDFAQLVKYITDSQGGLERVGRVAITNCHSSEPELAALEVQAVQQLNQRSRADKTYHLIVSFRTGEDPPNSVLAAIEEKICKELGFAEHQRVSAAHYDTDNVHLHIAINKVHPVRHTVHSPYFDHIKLPAICAALEEEYGLAPDNHQTRKHGSENRVDDMERHAGVESLLNWVRRECLESLETASSWSAMHDVLHEHGLQLHARGNGLVITDADAGSVKASSVARSMSKERLEARLGTFEPSPYVDRAKPRGKKYEKRPKGFRIDTKSLYENYKAEQELAKTVRPAEAAMLRLRHNAEIAAIKSANAGKRAAIKLMAGDRLSKKILYGLASRAMKADLAKAREQHRRERRFVNARHARKAWADWLQSKAGAGDAQALAALRAREARNGLLHNALSGGESRSSAPLAGISAVTKKGTVIYSDGAFAIRDDGDRLQVSRGADRGGIHRALQMAHQKFGNRLQVDGSAEFKARVVATAAAQGLPISFADEDLERRFQALLVLKRGHTNDSKNGRGTHGRGHELDGSSTANQQHSGRGHARSGKPSGEHGDQRSHRVDAGRATTSHKPNVGFVGAEPPPFRKGVLRDLSQLGLVPDGDRGALLLPGDVPGHVEHKVAPPDHGVRRAVPGIGASAEALAAAAKLIEERNGKRGFAFDIPKYTGYTLGAESTVPFAGLRLVDGVQLALFSRDGAIEVLPVDKAAAQRLRRVKVGDSVTVTAQGSILTKGRSR